ncbi:MAG: LamG-like jellyroll fold domain-containing protein [Rhodoglobus sp.]
MTDYSGNAIFTVPGGATAPTYSYPWMVFDGTGGKHLRADSTTYGNIGSSWTIMVVFRTTTSGSIRVAACKGDGWTIGITAVGAPLFALDFGFGLVPIQDAMVEVNDGDPHLLIATYDGALEKFNFYLDGVQTAGSPMSVGALPGNTAGLTTPMRIGRGETSTLPWEGDIAMFGLYPGKAIDATEAAAMAAYSRAVYGTL